VSLLLYCCCTSDCFKNDRALKWRTFYKSFLLCVKFGCQRSSFCFACVFHIEHIIMCFKNILWKWIEIMKRKSWAFTHRRVLILCNSFSFLTNIIESVNVIICVHEISKVWWLKNGHVAHKCIYHLIDHFVDLSSHIQCHFILRRDVSIIFIMIGACHVIGFF